MAFTMVTITGDYDLADGLDPVGSVSFTPTDVMVNGPTVVTVPVRAQLDVDGLISIRLAANTDPLTTPAGVQYLVTESISGVSRSYPVQIPHNQGASLDITALTPGPS